MFDAPLYHLVFSHQAKAIYGPVPKAACSTLKAYFRRAAGLGEIDFDLLHRRRLNGLLYASAIERGELIRLLFTDAGYFKFTVVRNPFTRLVSAWRDLLAPRDDGQCRHQAEAERLLETHRRIADLRPSDCGSLTFETFVRLLPALDPAKMDRHWQPQTLVNYSDVIAYDLVVKLEELAERWGEIRDRLAFQEELGAPVNVGGAIDPGAWFTPELAEIARTVYADDFRQLGYDTAL